MSRHDLRDQSGFTLVELLVVMLIIGVLTSIGLPVFLGQQAKAQDGVAKSDARTAASAVESCVVELPTYDLCEAPGDVGVPLGTTPGRVEIDGDGRTYEIVAHSRTGNTFTIAKLADQSVEHTCSAAGNPRGACVGGVW